VLTEEDQFQNVQFSHQKLDQLKLKTFQSDLLKPLTVTKNVDLVPKPQRTVLPVVKTE